MFSSRLTSSEIWSNKDTSDARQLWITKSLAAFQGSSSFTESFSIFIFSFCDMVESNNKCMFCNVQSPSDNPSYEPPIMHFNLLRAKYVITSYSIHYTKLYEQFTIIFNLLYLQSKSYIKHEKKALEYSIAFFSCEVLLI